MCANPSSSDGPFEILERNPWALVRVKTRVSATRLNLAVGHCGCIAGIVAGLQRGSNSTPHASYITQTLIMNLHRTEPGACTQMHMPRRLHYNRYKILSIVLLVCALRYLYIDIL